MKTVEGKQSLYLKIGLTVFASIASFIYQFVNRFEYQYFNIYWLGLICYNKHYTQL